MQLPRAAPHACPATIERAVRLWSGIVLLVFVTTHLLNHAVGILGIPAMTAVQEVRVGLWRSWTGSVLLYGAGVLHVVLALKRAVTRSTWRMPAAEAVQLLLGLLIPVLLVHHLVGTRMMADQVGLRDTYVTVLRLLWPNLALGQIALLATAVLILLGRFVLSRLRPMVEVRFSGHAKVRSPRGLTLLEMARLHRIPHPSACGGRGRCATCRVRVLSGEAQLPEPTGLERGTLTRIRAPRHATCGWRARSGRSATWWCVRCCRRMPIPSAASGTPTPPTGPCTRR